MMRLFGTRESLLEALAIDWAETQLQLPRQPGKQRAGRRRCFKTSRRNR